MPIYAVYTVYKETFVNNIRADSEAQALEIASRFDHDGPSYDYCWHDSEIRNQWNDDDESAPEVDN